MTGPYLITQHDWDQFVMALFWIALLGGMAGAFAVSLIADAVRWIGRRIERRQYSDASRKAGAL